MSGIPGVVTTTVERLHELLPTGDASLRGVAIRLRTASIAFFELDGLSQSERGYHIIIGRHIDSWTGERVKGSRHGKAVYASVTADHLIDVRGLDIPRSLQVPVRGWEDMYLADVYISRKDRP